MIIYNTIKNNADDIKSQVCAVSWKLLNEPKCAIDLNRCVDFKTSSRYEP